MDILAHGLWTNIMYKAIPQTRHNRKATWWGIFFGIFPDLVSFTPVFVYGFYESLFRHQPFLAGPPGGDNPFFNYAVGSYNFSHSLVIFAAVFILAWLITRKIPFVLLGWALHICIDIFSHTEAFFATPFLFPISNFKVSVISWAHPWFMAINYSLLVLLYLFIVPRFRSKAFA